MDIVFKLPDLRQLQGIGDEIDKVTKYAGVSYLNHFKQAFRDGGFTDEVLEPWPGRDFTAGTKQRATLVNTGGLRRSLSLAHGQARFTITSAVPYAKLHNEGGRVRITRKMRKLFWALHFKAKKGNRLVEADYYKSLALAKGKYFNVPRRRFMGQSRVVQAKIRARLEHVMREAVRGMGDSRLSGD